MRPGHLAAIGAICRAIAVYTAHQCSMPHVLGYSKIATQCMKAATAIMPDHDHSAPTLAAVAAIASLLSVGETPSVRPSTTQGRGTDSEEGIREESREALRDVLRNIDSDAGSRQ